MLWIIYLADIVGSIEHFLGFIGSIGFIVFCASAFCFIFVQTEESNPKWYGDTCKVPRRIPWEAGIRIRKYSKVFLVGSLIVFTTAFPTKILIPSKDAIYMMTGVYMGQQIAMTDEAKETFLLVKKNIDKYLKEALQE